MPDIDKNKVSAAFSRAAGVYDAQAHFQHQVCEHLTTFLPVDFKPARILDGGCGTGFGASLLQQHWPEATVNGCDIAPEMVRKTLERGIDAVCGDLEQLPFASSSFDLIWSSLALQWCRPELAFAEFHRILASTGKLVFTTLALGTLRELDAAFSGIDPYRRMLPFCTADEVNAALAIAGFHNIRITQESWVTYHADFPTLLSTIRGIGASHAGSNRRMALMGKNAWQMARTRYEKMCCADGRLPATYEVLFIQADTSNENTTRTSIK